jgi:hypothetical protein
MLALGVQSFVADLYRFRGDQDKGDYARRGAAIDPIMYRAAQNEHINLAVGGLNLGGRGRPAPTGSQPEPPGRASGLKTVFNRLLRS